MGFELFHLYLGFLVFGVGYAVIISLLGSFGGDGVDAGHGDASGCHDGGDFSADCAHDGSHWGGDGLLPFSPLFLATVSTLFGGLGFITLGLTGIIQVFPPVVANVVSLLVSASLSVVLASYFSLFLVKLFVKTETSSNISVAKLIGREAEVILDLDNGKLGEVAYFHGGSRQTNMAKLIEGSPPAKKGEIVEIIRITDNVMWVKVIEKKEENSQ